MERSLAGLAELLDQLEYSISDLVRCLASSDLEPARRPADAMVSVVRAINDLLPKEKKTPKGAFRQLQKHAQFVRLYLDRGNVDYVRSNATALTRDVVRLRAELAHSLSEDITDLAVNVEQLAAGPAKKSLREAVSNFQAGTFGSAIVSAVNALEGYFRELRRDRLSIDPQKGRLVDVIQDLERGRVLSNSESPLAHIARLYRNYSAHPSGFVATAADARMIIQFVFAKLKAR